MHLYTTSTSVFVFTHTPSKHCYMYYSQVPSKQCYVYFPNKQMLRVSQPNPHLILLAALQFEGPDTTIRGVRHCKKSVYLQNCREISGFLPKISREQIWPAGAVCAPLVSQHTQHSIKSPCFQYTKIKYGITAQNSDFSEDFKQVVLDFWKYRTRRYNYSIVGPSNPRGIYLRITRDYSNCCVHGSCKEDALRAYIGSLYARVLYHLARWKGSLKMHKY